VESVFGLPENFTFLPYDLYLTVFEMCQQAFVLCRFVTVRRIKVDHICDPCAEVNIYTCIRPRKEEEHENYITRILKIYRLLTSTKHLYVAQIVEGETGSAYVKPMLEGST